MSRKVNQKELERLDKLYSRLVEHYTDPARQSFTIWRGDYRAIEYARWLIRKMLAEGR
jgi:hypothetical protein